MIIVTGGLGFIGSNIVKELNLNGIEDIIIVDSVSNKKSNLNQLKFIDLIDKDILKPFCTKVLVLIQLNQTLTIL